ncbi:MAG: cytidylyltransferase domain-containing protein [Mangrovibacterium sp.]
MSDFSIIIQARTGSTRMPQKVILPFYQSRSIIGILFERLLSTCPVPVILATTTSPSDDPLAEIAAQYSVKLFRGPEDNVLGRFILAAEEYGCRNIVRVCADNPFLSASSINQLIENFSETPADYMSFVFSEDRPSIRTHFGFFAEITRLEALKKVASLTHEKLYLEHVTNFLYTHPELFDIHFLKAPEIIFNRKDIRLTLDTPKDFALQQQIFSELSQQNSNFEVPEIVRYLDQHPDLLAEMSREIRRNEK